MSESDSSSPSEAFEAALHELADELKALIEATADGARPVDLDAPIGRLSRMDAIQQKEMSQASRSAAERRLLQVRAALQRIDADEYGDCLDCGAEIGHARLSARPEAPFCIACQSRREGS